MIKADAGGDEHLGHVAPQPEFDLLAVQEPELTVRGQRLVRDDVIQRDGLVGAGLAHAQQVAVHQGEIGPLVVLVDAEVHDG